VLDQAEALEARAAWIKVEHAEQVAVDAEAEHSRAAAALSAVVRAAKNAAAPLEARRANKKAAENEARKAADKRRQNVKACEKTVEMADKRIRAMQEARRKIEGLSSSLEKSRDELAKLKTELPADERAVLDAERAKVAAERALEKARAEAGAAANEHLQLSEALVKARQLHKESLATLGDANRALREADALRNIITMRVDMRLQRARGAGVSIVTAQENVRRAFEGGGGGVGGMGAGGGDADALPIPLKGRGVWGPLAAELSVRGIGGGNDAAQTRLAAAVVEALIPLNTLASWVVTDLSDRDRVASIAGPHVPGVQVLTVAAPGGKGGGGSAWEISRPDGEASDYDGLGLFATVDDLILAPGPIKQALADICQTNRTFVAKQGVTVEDVINNVFRAYPKVSRVVVLPDPAAPPARGPGAGTGAVLVQRLHSRYAQGGDGGCITKLIDWATVLSEAGGGAAGDDAAATAISARRNAALQQRIDDAKGESAARKRRLDDAQAAVQAAADLLKRKEEAEHAMMERRQAARRKLSAAKTSVKTKEALVREHEKKLADPETERRELEDKLADSARRQHMSAAHLATAAVAAALQASLGAVEGLRAIELDLQGSALSRQSDAHANDLADKKRAEALAAQRAKQMRKIADGERARTHREKPEPRGSGPVARLYAAIDATRTAQDLIREARALAARAASMSLGNSAVAAQYEKAVHDIQVARDAAAKAAADVDALTAEMDAIESDWLPELRRVIDAINANFSANFARIGCAGEVALVEGERGQRSGGGGASGGGAGGGLTQCSDEDEDNADGGAQGDASTDALRARDYASWRAEVRVQFRASEPLSVLTALRQSGGERSVSTILYLVALQGVTVTPFRVVDEINQGMDPVNERKVFRLLVEASTQPGTPQCFLLTPKLLPGLPFGPDVTVLSIFNGMHVAADAAAGLTRQRLYGARYDKQRATVAAARAHRDREARRRELLEQGAAEMDGGAGVVVVEDDDEEAARAAAAGGGRRGAAATAAAAGGGGRGRRGGGGDRGLLADDDA
jgi:hypothetical protein